MSFIKIVQAIFEKTGIMCKINDTKCHFVCHSLWKLVKIVRLINGIKMKNLQIKNINEKNLTSTFSETYIKNMTNKIEKKT